MRLLSEVIRKAMINVSKSFGSDESRVQSELLKKLMEVEKESYKASKLDDGDQTDQKSSKKDKTTSSDKELSSLLGSMKVERKGADKESARMGRDTLRATTDQILHRYKKATETSEDRHPIQRRLELKQKGSTMNYAKTNFFDPGPGLEIFGPVADKLKSSPPLVPVWENLERRKLKQLTARTPRNGFEEFIQWTEEGRMHPYPIDNEYGLYELGVSFHEHVFLDHLLDDGFPTSGPIRHFMELVVHGLSSNPYMTVEKKHGHVAWFRDYFKQRGAEIEQQHALDLKHQQAMAEFDEASVAQSTVSSSAKAPAAISTN